MRLLKALSHSLAVFQHSEAQPKQSLGTAASPRLQRRDGLLQDLPNKEQIFRAICRLCVSDVLATPSSNDISAVQKAKTLYRSCINESKCLLTLLHVGYIHVIQTLPSSQSAVPTSSYLLCTSSQKFFVKIQMYPFYRLKYECQ